MSKEFVCDKCGVGCANEQDLARHKELVGYHQALEAQALCNAATSCIGRKVGRRIDIAVRA